MPETIYIETVDFVLKDGTRTVIPLRAFDSDNAAAKWLLSDECAMMINALKAQYSGLWKEICYYTEEEEVW